MSAKVHRPPQQPPVPGEIHGSDVDELLRVVGLTKHFSVTTGTVFRREIARVHAVDNVSFVLHRGRTLGLLGESGCGKTTVARTTLRLVEPSAGRIIFQNTDVTSAEGRDLRSLRRDMQIVYQDPFSSLNPRLTIGQIVAEPLRVHDIPDRGQRTAALLDQVGIRSSYASRYPHEFSGGQRQRIAIARALATHPPLLFCDEPTAALDVSIQGQILNLLTGLQDELGLTYVLISHDLSIVRDVADQVAVMYLGQIVESGTTTEVFHGPHHPYTIALLSAVPIPDPVLEDERERIILQGDVPSPSHPPPGCRFHTRCWKAGDICRTTEPPMVEFSPGHRAACHFPENSGPSTDQRSAEPPAIRPFSDGHAHRRAQNCGSKLPS